MPKQNFEKVLLSNDQQLSNDVEGMHTNRLFEVVEETVNEVIIPTDQVGFSNDGSLDLVVKNDLVVNQLKMI